MLCASVSPAPHLGQWSSGESCGLVEEECSPMYFINSSVAAGASCRSLCMSNQKAWQGAHTSMVSCVPRRLPSVQSVMGAEQLEQFMAMAFIVSSRDCLAEV